MWYSVKSSICLLVFKMLWIERIRTVKVWLVIIAVVIAIASLVTSHFLIRDLQAEETKSVEVWAEAMRSLNMADENTDLNLVLKVIRLLGYEVVRL